MTMAKETLADFTSALYSKAPVPGGGGASALCGALAVSLGSMVGSLTVGKKKYADVEDEVYQLLGKGERLRSDLLELIDVDAAAFEPLSKAYGIPKDDPNRDEILQSALIAACTPPMNIMRTIAKAIECINRMAQIGSRLVLSDAGVGATFAKAALQGAALNVFINTKMITDKEVANALETEAQELLDTYGTMAQETYDYVMGYIRG